MYLIFDSSANGRPKSYKASLDDAFNWPRMMHLSWIILGEDLKPISDYNCLIKPHGYAPTEEALKMHHLEKDKLIEKGDDLSDVLEQFEKSVNECQYVFAHNLKYNQGIVGSEYYRLTKPSPLTGADSYCLMQEGTYYCKLPGKKGYKWPSLQEMHRVIFSQSFTPANNARADVIAAARCFIFLKKARALEDIFVE